MSIIFIDFQKNLIDTKTNRNSQFSYPLNDQFEMLKTRIPIHKKGTTSLSDFVEISFSTGIVKKYYFSSPNFKDIFNKNGNEKVIDPNVYDFEFITNDAIYYTVGNKLNRSLYRYNLRNEEVEEVITRFKTEDYVVIGDYIYYYTGDAYNYTLKKYGLYTAKTIILASNIKRSFKIADGYFYYEDNYNRLCSIRIDGTDFHMLAENVTDFIGVHNNRVYYVREEYAGKEVTTDTRFDKEKGKVIVEQKHDKIGCSLYACTSKGTEVKKIAFDTYQVMAKEKDMENLLIVYRENKSFRCITPGQDSSPFKRIIFRFTNLNLTTGEQEIKFTTNYPGETTIMIEKRGCFLFRKKQKEVKLEYEELENHEKYKKEDLVEAGYIGNRETITPVSNAKRK